MFCKVRKVQLSLATVLAVVSDVLECREDLEEINKGKFTSIEDAGKRWCFFYSDGIDDSVHCFSS